MSTASAGAGDFDSPIFDVFSCLSETLGQIQGAVRRMSGAHGPDWHGGPWEWASRTQTEAVPPHKQWAGGFGGPWGRSWPSPPGSPGARGRKAGRGDVRAAILALLREGPRNGYQIMSEIEERSDGAWRPSPGAVYPALAQLADEGLIAGEESGGRRTYSLTEAGRSYVEENPEMARGSWESRTQQESWQVPGLFTQAARLGAGIVQMAQAGTPEQIHAAERLLEQTRRRLYQLLADDADEGDDTDDHEDDVDEA